MNLYSTFVDVKNRQIFLFIAPETTSWSM